MKFPLQNHLAVLSVFLVTNAVALEGSESTDIETAYTSQLHSTSEIKNRKLDPLNPRVDKFQKGKFPVGFYLYGSQDIEPHIQKMAELGFTSIHLTNTNDIAQWDKILELSRSCGLSALVQINTAYLTKNSQVDELIPKAVSFIRRYKNDPSILAFSVREEPSESLMPKLREYYEGIYKEIPDAPIYLLFNYLSAMKAGKPPYPLMTGTDRYNFWWEFGTAGNRASPSSALRWYSTQLNAFYQESLRQNSEFFAVFTALPAEEEAMLAGKVKEKFYPAEISDSERDRLEKMVFRLAEEKNQGWWEPEPGVLRHWKYYAAPTNTTRAMCWLSVMEGAKAIYCYHWIRQFTPRGEHKYQEHPMTQDQINEYSEFAREIQRYGSLIRAMVKEFAPYKGNPLGHQVVESPDVEDLPFKINGDKISWRSFSVEGYKGKVVIIVNTDVGEWVDGRSPQTITAKHIFRIDEKGKLVDYKAKTDSRRISISIPKDEVSCLDLSTGNLISPDDQGNLNTLIDPGAGRVLFVFPKDTNEAENLKREFQL